MSSLQNFNKKTFQTGFTLVELLVVIAILGIIGAGLIAAINPAAKLGQARDVRRKAALREIYQALESYYLTYGSYPPAGGCAMNTNCYVNSTAGSSWIPALVTSGQLKSVPVDPINNGGAPWTVGANGYEFYYGNVGTNGSGDYDLIAHLENPNDPDRCELKDYLFSAVNGGGHWCQAFPPGQYSNQLYERSPKNIK